MNNRIKELAEQAGLESFYVEYSPWQVEFQKFAELIVFDFLDELTNDDSLGEARIKTIHRLATKWGVNKNE